MESAEMARRYLSFFEERGHTVVPSAAHRRRPDAAAGQRGHGPLQAVLPRRAQAALPSGPPACRSACARRTSKRSARPPGTARSSRCAATSPSATTSRKAPSRYAWELLTSRRVRRRVRLPRDRLWVTVYHDDDEAASIWHDRSACPPSASSAGAWPDNYWSMGVPGPCGPCSEINYDRGPEYGARGRPGRRRGPLPGDLEPGLHAVRARRRRRQGGLPDPRRPARQEHRHRHGPGAHGVDPAGRRQHLRDRHHPAVIDRATELTGTRVRRATTTPTSRCGSSPTTCAPRVMLIGDGVTARQRGPRLRAAPHHAPRHPQHAAARAASEPVACTSSSTSRIAAMGAAVPGADADRRADPRRSSTPRRPPSWQDPAHRHHDLRHGGDGDQGAGGTVARRRPGLPAPRHLRLPDRPHPGDGRRAGPVGRRGRLPPADEGAAGPGQGRRRGQEDRPRRHLGATAGCSSRRGEADVHRLRPTSRASATVVGLLVDGVPVARGAARATRSRSSSTAPRSTPRAAASSPTRA